MMKRTGPTTTHRQHTTDDKDDTTREHTDTPTHRYTETPQTPTTDEPDDEPTFFPRRIQITGKYAGVVEISSLNVLRAMLVCHMVEWMHTHVHTVLVRWTSPPTSALRAHRRTSLNFRKSNKLTSKRY